LLTPISAHFIQPENGEYNGKSFRDKVQIFFLSSSWTHWDERDVSFSYHCIGREINNNIIFFIEQQNQPLVAAMSNRQVAGKTSDKGASGKSF